MTRYTTQLTVTLTALFILATTIVLPLQPVFGEGGARRDVVRAEEQSRQEAIQLTEDAVAHGTQGHAGALLTSAQTALQHAMNAGKDAHVDAGVRELKQAIEHGKAGHVDVATKHAEQAITHLSER
jgi:Small metal-binding protein